MFKGVLLRIGLDFCTRFDIITEMKVVYNNTEVYFRAEPKNENRVGNSFHTYPKARRYAGKLGKVTKVTIHEKCIEQIMP